MFVNDEHFEDFTYRGDPENISTLNIKGRVNIQETEYLGSMVGLSVCLSLSHPVLYMFSCTLITWTKILFHAIFKLSLMEVESGLEPGDIFVLNGIVDKKGDPYVYLYKYVFNI